MKKYFAILYLLLCFLIDLNASETTTLQKAPSFYAPGLNTKNFFLSKHVGKKVNPNNQNPVLLSFFTTSCIPCRDEIPYLVQIMKKHNLTNFYLINIRESKELIKKYIDKTNCSLPVLMDKYGVIAKKFNVSSTPALIIISKEGNIVYQHSGFNKSDTLEIYNNIENVFINSDPESTRLLD